MYLTVAQTPVFERCAAKIWSEDELDLFVNWIALNPLAGDVIPGSGGLRKVRWSASGRGKRGGARVIYFLHSERLPLFLLTAYAKNERADLSAADRAAFKQMVKELATTYRRRRES